MGDGMIIYQTGGAVRDSLLGIDSKDRDWLVLGTTPEALVAQGYRPRGRDFTVFIHPHTGEEYALPRGKPQPAARDGRPAGPMALLTEDLRCRDLTINAMAKGADGELVDPFGGQQDLETGVIRHVSEAFGDDPLRVLRAARFSARFGYDIAPETRALMRDISASGALNKSTPERIWGETLKALETPAPARYFEALRSCGALAALFPEIDNLFGVPQRPEYHPEIDCGVHTFMALGIASSLTPDPQVRFAALVHDLGKATTLPEILPGHHAHEARGVPLVAGLCDRIKAPADYKILGMLVSQYHLECHRILESKPKSILRKLEKLDAFRRPERFNRFLLACEADARGRKGLEDKPYPQSDLLRRCLSATSDITATALGIQHHSPARIANDIRHQRIAAIRRVVQQTDTLESGPSTLRPAAPA